MNEAREDYQAVLKLQPSNKEAAEALQAEVPMQ